MADEEHSGQPFIKRKKGRFIMRNFGPQTGPLHRPINRRRLLMAGTYLTGGVMLTPLSQAFAATLDDVRDDYTSANINWKQLSGSKITLAGLTHPWMEAITPLVPIFTELTGIEVVVSEQSNTEFVTEMPIKLAAKNPTPDVFMVWAQGQAISGGWLEPLTPYLEDSSLHDAAWWDDGDNFPGANSFAVWGDGVSYSRAITAEAQTLFVNNAILRSKGVALPETFDDLKLAASAIKDDDVSGIAMRGKATGDAVAWPAGGYVFSYGGGILGLDGAVAMDSAEAIAGVDMYAATLRDGGPLGVGNYHWLEALNDFLQGATAFGCDSSNFATDISNPEKSTVVADAGFLPLPKTNDGVSKPNLWHWLAGVNAFSENKKAAWLFLMWATSRPTSTLLAAAGLATTRTSAWESDAFKTAFGASAAEAALVNLSNADGDIMKATWFHPQSGEVLDAFAIAVNESITGARGTEEALTEAAQKARRALGQ
jgi:multiple sugar transport system substrate-binding protein